MRSGRDTAGARSRLDVHLARASPANRPWLRRTRSPPHRGAGSVLRRALEAPLTPLPLMVVRRQIAAPSSLCLTGAVAPSPWLVVVNPRQQAGSTGGGLSLIHISEP